MDVYKAKKLQMVLIFLQQLLLLSLNCGFFMSLVISFACMSPAILIDF